MLVITVARKPLGEGTVAKNALQYGTGGLNIDACRIGLEVRPLRVRFEQYRPEGFDLPSGSRAIGQTQTGRWPANLLLSHLEGCRQTGTKRVSANQSTSVGSGLGHKGTKGNGIYHGVGGQVRPSTADSEGKETVASWDCEAGCPVAALDDQSGEIPSSLRQGNRTAHQKGVVAFHKERGAALDREGLGYTDSGGASRFFKTISGSK